MEISEVHAVCFASTVSESVLSRLAPGDHICCFHSDPADLQRLLAPFIAGGLDKGDRVLVLRDRSTIQAGLTRQWESTIGSVPTEGQLKVVPIDDFFALLETPDARRVLDRFAAECEEAVSDGFRGVRFAAEVSEILEAGMPWQTFCDIERELDLFIPKRGCLTIFFYEERYFEPHQILEILHGHRHILLDDAICENTSYRSDDYSDLSPSSPELKEWLRNHHERRDLMRALAECRQSAELAVEERHALSSLFSHDLRTPLWCVQNLALMLAEEKGSGLDGEAMKALDDIRASSQEIVELLDTFNAFSRLDVNPPKVEAIDMSQLALEVIEELKQKAAPQDLPFRVEDLPPCTGDRSSLKVALRCGLANAAYAMLEIRSGPVELTGRATQEGPLYALRDVQNIMRLEGTDEIFDLSYWRRTASAPGRVGIRFATFKKIIQRHGGRVWVTADPDRPPAGMLIGFALPAELTDQAPS